MTPDTPTQAAALPELLPCSFCGHQTARVITSASELAAEGEDDDYEPYPHSETWAVICDASGPNGPGGCGASGGFKFSELEAAEAWNRRADTALQEACAEIERQQAVIIDMGGALRSVVNAIKGAPGPDAAHSTHDAADLVRQVCAERDALRAALKPFADCAAEYMAGGIYEVYVSGSDLINARAAITDARKEGASHAPTA